MSQRVLVVACVLASSVAFAEETKPLSADVEVGVIYTSGNTNTESLKGRIDLRQDLTNWKNQYILEGLFKKDEVDQEENGETVTIEQTTAEKYFGSVKSDFKINKKHAALFGYAEYDRDRFNGYEYQYTVALGYSDRLFTKDNSYLGYSVGPGFTVERPDPILDVRQDEESNVVVRVQLEYRYDISEHSKFTQDISSNYAIDSDKNSKTKSVTAITAKINSKFTMRASFTLKYNSQVPEGNEYADTETAFTVVYNF